VAEQLLYFQKFYAVGQKVGSARVSELVQRDLHARPPGDRSHTAAGRTSTGSLSKREAAAALGVSQSTIDRLRREAGLPAVQLEGRVMFRPAALDAWAASRETARNAGPTTIPKTTLDKAHSME